MMKNNLMVEDVAQNLMPNSVMGPAVEGGKNVGVAPA